MGSSTVVRLAWTTRSATVGIPNFRNFPVLPWGIITYRTSTGPNSPDSASPEPDQESLDPNPGLDHSHGDLVDPRGPGPGVRGHAFPCMHQKRRVIDEVEQVIEPAGVIRSRPFGANLVYILRTAKNARSASGHSTTPVFTGASSDIEAFRKLIS
jgi:hypothetical protein